MATSKSSYLIVRQQRTRIFVYVNARPGDHVDELIVFDHCTNERTVSFYKYYQGIRSELFDDGLPCKTFRLEFTSINESVANIRLTDKKDRVLDNEQLSMGIATYIMWLESVRANSVKISGMSKEKEGEICVICLEDYQADDMIGTLECKHGCHEECIKTWLQQKNACPVCHAAAVKLTEAHFSY